MSGNFQPPNPNVTPQEWQGLLQMLAERRNQPEVPTPGVRQARRDVFLPKWNGRAIDFGFYVGRLETRIITDFAPFFDECSICLDVIDTLPENLKSRVSGWFDSRRAGGNFSWRELIQYLQNTFTDRQGQQAASELLDRMEQGEHQLFADFLQDFNYRLAQSGGDEAHTVLGKTQKLKAAMNNQLRRALIGLKLPSANKHEEWVAEVREIALEVEAMADYRPRGATNTRTRYGAPKSGVALSVPRSQGVDSEGDVRMGGTNALMAGIRGLALEDGEREGERENPGEYPTADAANAVGHDDGRPSLPRAPWRSQQEGARSKKRQRFERYGGAGKWGPLSKVALKGADGISSVVERVLCSQPLVIVGLLNASFPTKAMVDTGCLCFSVIDENLVRAHNIHIESIPSRPLRLAVDSKTAVINQIAKYELDIGGHRELMWAYVMTNLAYPIILGKPWMEKNRVIYAANKPSLKIENRELLKQNAGNSTPVQAESKLPTGINRQDLIGRERVVGIISKTELERALEPKKTITREEIRANLPVCDGNQKAGYDEVD
ncbi:hypothetical protein K3495_g11862 [Podosphaera aphanis]|nr:hypothetical protein K3495_g11862 [Podosphaera aphanis]